MPDPFTEPVEEKNFFTLAKKFLKLSKAILLTKFPINILIILIVVALSITGFQYLMPGSISETITGNVILEAECPECVCEPTEETECVTDCSTCPIKTKVETKNVIYYKCSSGALVKDLDECTNIFPNVSVESSGTVEGVTLVIDNIEFEEDDKDSGFVTRVDYTIINKGDYPVVPKIEVKVYEEWTLKTKKSVANKVIFPEVVVNPNDYVKRKDRVRIYFNGPEQTVRLLLINRLPKIEEDLIAVTRDIDLDYAD